MFVERNTKYTSFSSRKQPANTGSEGKQFTENASVALQQTILTHAHTKCPPVVVHSRPQCLRVWECARKLWETLRRSSQNLAIWASQRMLLENTVKRSQSQIET